MSNLSIYRVGTLPDTASLQPSSMYITREASNPALVNLTFVGDSASEVRHVFGVTDTQAAIATAIDNLTAADIPDLPGSKIISDLSVNTTGNAATATLATRATNADNATFASTAGVAESLAPGATINGVQFTGADNITVPAVDTATPRVPMSGIGTLVAPLVDGVVPTQYLPAGLDNMETFPTRGDFPATGLPNVIYIDAENNAMYRWASDGEGGGTFILIPSGSGTIESALRLVNKRQFTLEGDVTGLISSDPSGFDGSANVTITATLADIGAGGTGSKVTVNEKGLVTDVEALTAADIPALPGSKITSDLSVNTTGNAATADKLKTARTITVTGAASGSVVFDGSGDASLVLSGSASGVTAGTYTKVTVNAAGLVTAGDALVAADIPNLPGTKIVSDLTVNTSGKAATAGVADSAKSIELAAAEW